MSTPSPSAPVLPVQPQTTAGKGFLSLHIVTASCLGVRNSYLTPPDVEPDWFAALDSNLATARLHAGHWVDDLAPQLTSTIPTQLLKFGARFDAAADDILDLLNQAEQNGLTDVIKNSIADDIDDLREEIQQITTAMDNVSDQMTAFAATLKADHDALFSGVASIQAGLAHLRTDIDRINNDISTLDADIAALRKQYTDSMISLGVGLFVTVIGIALTPVNPGVGLVVIAAGVITDGVAGGFAGHFASQMAADQTAIANDQAAITDDQKQVVSLNALSVVASGAVDCINDAIAHLSDVRSLWTQYDEMLAGISTQLQNSTSDNIVVDKVYINEAQDQWTDMVAFAEGLMQTNNNVTTQNVDLPYPNAA
jgi:prefoldin subunit 5